MLPFFSHQALRAHVHNVDQLSIPCAVAARHFAHERKRRAAAFRQEQVVRELAAQAQAARHPQRRPAKSGEPQPTTTSVATQPTAPKESDAASAATTVAKVPPAARAAPPTPAESLSELRARVGQAIERRQMRPVATPAPAEQPSHSPGAVTAPVASPGSGPATIAEPASLANSAAPGAPAAGDAGAGANAEGTSTHAASKEEIANGSTGIALADAMRDATGTAAELAGSRAAELRAGTSAGEASVPGGPEAVRAAGYDRARREALDKRQAQLESAKAEWREAQVGVVCAWDG